MIQDTNVEKKEKSRKANGLELDKTESLKGCSPLGL